MIGQAIFVLYSVIAVGQVQQEDSFDIASQARFQALQKGQYEVATGQRERMNQLLQTLAPDQPQFAGRAQNVAQIYENDGMSATGRAVLEGALGRAEGAKAPGQVRISLSLSLANFWDRDRNFLKSLASLEKAATILEQTPTAEEAAQRGDRVTGFGQAIASRPGGNAVFGSLPFGLSSAINRAAVYMRLADLYQRLGRQDQATAVLAKVKALPSQSNNWSLAQYYQQHGDTGLAAEIYRKQMEDSASDPQQMLFSAEALANLYEQMKRPDDAVAVLREAITAIDASGKPDLVAQSNGMRQRLAMLLYRSGHAEAADQAFPQPAENAPAGAGLALSYSNYLGSTKRQAQAKTFLADYLAGHPSLNPGEQGVILSALASLARMNGDSKRADEYQLESDQKRLPKDPPADALRIGPTLQKAQTEANVGNTAEAIALVTQAIAQSGTARDREVLAGATSVTNVISARVPVQADELYRNVIEVTQSWSADTMQPWLAVLEGYPRFLLSQQRISEVFPVIERYRSALTTSRGVDTGWLEEPLRLTIELERVRNSPQAAILAVQNLLVLEETLDGPTSEPLYRAAETLADLYRSTSDSVRALPVYRQTIAIADAVFRADDPRRVQSRTNAAVLLIVERRPDEAELLVMEAIALRKTAPTGGRDQLTQLLDQIHAMKTSR